MPLLFLACTQTCTNTWTETPQRTRKRKASTRTPFVEEGNGDRPWEVLYDYIVDPTASQPSEKTSGAFPLKERTFPSWKELSLQVFRVDDGWYTYPSALTDIILCLTMIFATLLVHCGWSMKQYTCELKIVTGLPWERFQILIFCVVIARSFPSLPLLRHYALLDQRKSF